MSSSRDYTFSFSPDVCTYLGPASAFNAAVRQHHPTLFDGSARTRPFTGDLRKYGLMVQPGAHIPVGTPLALFGGHIFEGRVIRSEFAIPMPPFLFRGV